MLYDVFDFIEVGTIFLAVSELQFAWDVLAT